MKLRRIIVLLSAAAAALTVAAVVPTALAETSTPNATGGKPAVAVVEYDLGDTAFTDRETGTVSEIRAIVHYPRALPGTNPLVVMAHGSWWSCDTQDMEPYVWPCPEGSRPFPSYRGYDYLGEALAEQGFVTVSISVDAINSTSFDYGDRARLVNEHLRLWQQLVSKGSGPLAGRFVDPATGRQVSPHFARHVDMRRVGTLGHSRGGKGVMWQASDKHRGEWPAGVTVRSVLGLAPVKFDYPEGDNSDTLITRLPFAVVTGGCDGATGEDGQEYLDDAAGKSKSTVYSISLPTANHNYFNTTWTPPFLFGEDDSTCPDRELTPTRQQSALVTYAVAFFKYTLMGDRDARLHLTGERPLAGYDAKYRVVPVN